MRETLALTASLFADTRPVAEVMQRAGIAEIADRRVGLCSGGQQQHLRFAMALLSDPGLLILDEPTTGMDVEGRRAFWSAIRADAARGRTVLFATHYLDEADEYADRIVLMSRGRIVADGTTAEIKNLVSGRVVRATLPGADPVALAALPGVDDVELKGDTVAIHTKDSDAVSRHLLTRTPARDLEVTAQNLESVFLALTADAPGIRPDSRSHSRRIPLMTTAAADRVALDRRVPPLGGFNLTYLGIELKRKLRNRRTLVFTIAFPVLMFVLIGLPLRISRSPRRRSPRADRPSPPTSWCRWRCTAP